jgi:hypothetical protein
MAISSKYSGGTGSAPQGVSINDNRRIFNFGEKVAELNPVQSPFFTYLSKVSRKPTDDPVFKFLEQRHQWQRRNFKLESALGATAPSSNGVAAVSNLRIMAMYDEYGRATTVGQPCNFILGGDSVGQVIQFNGVWEPTTDGTETDDIAGVIGVRITNVDGHTAASGSTDGYTQIDGDIISFNGKPLDSTYTTGGNFEAVDASLGQVIGSAHPEGGKAPDGWEDALYDREGYCQIFKTGMKLFSGTAMATKYRGEADEFKRIWRDKLMEHKMDIEHAMLFGVGGADEAGSGPVRKSWGILPYTEQYGSNFAFTYNSSTYDSFLDAMETYFAPESGNSGDKLVLASRKVIGWLNKLGDNNFLHNSIGASSYKIDVQNVQGAFGHAVTKVNTIFGNLHFVADPLLRGLYENYAIAVDTGNVAYRPLVGNGSNRDTQIMTNIQGNDEDGRRDMVLTEAGLEISLPETHAVMKWS